MRQAVFLWIVLYPFSEGISHIHGSLESHINHLFRVIIHERIRCGDCGKMNYNLWLCLTNNPLAGIQICHVTIHKPFLMWRIATMDKPIRSPNLETALFEFAA